MSIYTMFSEILPFTPHHHTYKLQVTSVYETGYQQDKFLHTFCFLFYFHCCKNIHDFIKKMWSCFDLETSLLTLYHPNFVYFTVFFSEANMKLWYFSLNIYSYSCNFLNLNLSSIKFYKIVNNQIFILLILLIPNSLAFKGWHLQYKIYRI